MAVARTLRSALSAVGPLQTLGRSASGSLVDEGLRLERVESGMTAVEPSQMKAVVHSDGGSPRSLSYQE